MLPVAIFPGIKVMKVLSARRRKKRANINKDLVKHFSI